VVTGWSLRAVAERFEDGSAEPDPLARPAAALARAPRLPENRRFLRRRASCRPSRTRDQGCRFGHRLQLRTASYEPTPHMIEVATSAADQQGRRSWRSAEHVTRNQRAPSSSLGRRTPSDLDVLLIERTRAASSGQQRERSQPQLDGVVNASHSSRHRPVRRHPGGLSPPTLGPADAGTSCGKRRHHRAGHARASGHLGVAPRSRSPPLLHSPWWEGRAGGLQA
jgi:hypothetical protein